MAFIYLHLEFAGDSSLDQPVFIRAVVRDSKNSPMDDLPDFERKVCISRTQIWNPITASFYQQCYQGQAQQISMNQGELPEKDVAFSFHKFLTDVYNKFLTAPVYWIGDFLYGSHIHQLRSFFIRHGLSPYFNYNKNTILIDSRFFPDNGDNSFGANYKVVEGEIARNPDSMFSKLGFPQSVLSSHWIKFQTQKRIPFVGEIAPVPNISMREKFTKPGKIHIPVQKRGKLHKSVFVPISSNDRGALLVDAGAWYLSLTRDNDPKSISDCLFWINYSACILRKSSNDDVDAQLLKKEAIEHLKGNKESYDFLKDGVSTDYYFQLVNEKNKGVDPEIAIYGHNIDLKNLGALYRAIYQNDTKNLEDLEDKVLTLFYLRHIIRSHMWSNQTYVKSKGEDDLEIKEFLKQYSLYRYKKLSDKREFSTGKAVTSIGQMFQWMENVPSGSEEVGTRFSEFLLSSEAYMALEETGMVFEKEGASA